MLVLKTTASIPALCYTCGSQTEFRVTLLGIELDTTKKIIKNDEVRQKIPNTPQNIVEILVSEVGNTRVIFVR